MAHIFSAWDVSGLSRPTSLADAVARCRSLAWIQERKNLYKSGQSWNISTSENKIQSSTKY